jgi:hypothetical protein
MELSPTVWRCHHRDFAFEIRSYASIPIGAVETSSRRQLSGVVKASLKSASPSATWRYPPPSRRQPERWGSMRFFNQGVARIGGRARDESYPARLPRRRTLADPVRQRPRLPEALAGQQLPYLPPIPGWRELIWPREGWPRVLDRIGRFASEGTSHRSQLQFAMLFERRRGSACHIEIAQSCNNDRSCLWIWSHGTHDPRVIRIDQNVVLNIQRPALQLVG